jgi:hypothetical protein
MCPPATTPAGYTPRPLPSSFPPCTLYIKMSQKSIITVLFALVIGVLLIFSQQAEASKGPIITNKVSLLLCSHSRFDSIGLL